MPESVACNLCGSSDHATLYVLKDFRFGIDEVPWPVVRCRRCGLGYLNPRPTLGEMTRYYPEAYFGHRGGLRRRYQRQARYLPSSPGRLLDIGTGRGDFLVAIGDLGWDVEGIEPSAAAGNPHGLRIHRLPFPGVGDWRGSEFDVVCAWAVFEHLHDPLAAFRESARLLKPGGHLIVQVPNLRSLRGRLGRSEDVPRHLYFFSPRTLEGYGTTVGLTLETIDHVTDLFSGASGREVFRYWAARAIGKSTEDFFRIYRTPRSERFRTWPITSALLATTGLVSRIVWPDWLVRAARLSGEIVAIYRKPHDAASSA
jgi:SAM-dependent methyltransferase